MGEANSHRKAASVVVFGEVLFDCFPDGQKVLGGAPFNVAWALQGFGCSPLFLSAVGEDSEGRIIKDTMNRWGLSLDGLGLPAHQPTGEVSVVFDGDEPVYEICEGRAWDSIDTDGFMATDVLYHGLLALRSEENRKSLSRLVSRSSAKRFFDLNLRAPYDDLDLAKEWIRGAHWLKLNLDELRQLSKVLNLELNNCDDEVARLMAEYEITYILVTGGAQGARLFDTTRSHDCMPAPKVSKLVDTVGAGDSFAACMIASDLKGVSGSDAIRQASVFAAKVCGMRGATCADRSFYGLDL